MRMSLNNKNRNIHIATRDVCGVRLGRWRRGAYRIARKPVSSRSESHWKSMKMSPTVVSDRYDTQHPAMIGTHP